MATNKQPIFSSAPDIQWGATPILAANTAMDGTGTTLLIFTADVSNGALIQKIIAKPLGTNIASVLRIWLNNALTPATAANNTFLSEISLTATVASASSALVQFECILNYAVPAGYRLYVTLGTAVASGYQITTIGSKL